MFKIKQKAMTVIGIAAVAGSLAVPGSALADKSNATAASAPSGGAGCHCPSGRRNWTAAQR